MKALRTLGNVLVGIILFALIFLLTFTRSTKNFLEKDLILGIMKGKIVDTIKEETGKITDQSQVLLDKMFEDGDASNVIRMVIDNFEGYQENKTGFKVSQKDIDTIYNYALKYKTTILEISGEKIKDVSDAEFKKLFSDENINKMANEIFKTIDKEVGKEVDTVIKVYSKATSSKMMMTLIGLIIFSILLLMLINWSLYRWMFVTGIDLIVSGMIITFIFLAGVFLTDMIASTEALKDIVGGINLNGYIIWGASEVILGIIMLIVQNAIKKKRENNVNNFNSNTTINQNTVSDNKEITDISQN